MLVSSVEGSPPLTGPAAWVLLPIRLGLLLVVLALLFSPLVRAMTEKAPRKGQSAASLEGKEGPTPSTSVAGSAREHAVFISSDNPDPLVAGLAYEVRAWNRSDGRVCHSLKVDAPGGRISGRGCDSSLMTPVPGTGLVALSGTVSADIRSPVVIETSGRETWAHSVVLNDDRHRVFLAFLQSKRLTQGATVYVNVDTDSLEAAALCRPPPRAVVMRCRPLS